MSYTVKPVNIPDSVVQFWHVVNKAGDSVYLAGDKITAETVCSVYNRAETEKSKRKEGR